MSDELRYYKCCPFCESKNIKETKEEWYLEKQRHPMNYQFPMEYQLGECLFCGETWNNR